MMATPKIQKIWLPEPDSSKSRSSLHTIMLTMFGVLATIIVGAPPLVILHDAGILERYFGRHAGAVDFLLFLLLVVLSMYILFTGIRKLIRYGNVFILLEDKRLFYLNLKQYVGKTHSGYSQFHGFKEMYYMDQYLNQIRRTGKFPTAPAEVLKVSRVKKTGPETFYVCWLLYPNEKPKKEAIAVSKKLPDVEELKMRLDFLRNASMPDEKPSRMLLYAILSFGVTALFILLSYFSHWDVAVLTNRIYYPALLGALISFLIGGCFYVYHRQGF